MRNRRSTVAQVYSVYEDLSQLEEDWDGLSEEERFGAVEAAMNRVSEALDGQIQWEIGVEDSDGNWEFYGSRRFDRDEAEREAIEQAEEDDELGSGLNVYQVNGPFVVNS